MSIQTENEFSRIIHIDDLKDQKTLFNIHASEDECIKLSQRFQCQCLELQASLTVEKKQDDKIDIYGQWSAIQEVGESKNNQSTYQENFIIRYQYIKDKIVLRDSDFLNKNMEDIDEYLEYKNIDLGEIVAQEFSLFICFSNTNNFLSSPDLNLHSQKTHKPFEKLLNYFGDHS